MKIYDIDINDITPYSRNTKKHDQTQIENVANSITKFGFVQPLVIDRNNEIVIGHCRMLAAKKLNMDTVPCVRVDDLTQEQINALRIVDNKTNESEWDIEFLTQELEEIDLSDFDFDFGLDLDTEDADLDVVEDEAPEIDEGEPTAQLGQIWKLGNHRLMCGDSTNGDNVAKLMNGETANLLVTDPPYNVALGQHMRPSELKQLHRRTDGLVIENDSWKDNDDFISFLVSAFKNAMDSMNPGASFYVWYADTQALNFRIAAQQAEMEVRQNLIWNKNTFAMGRQDYQWKHEPCLYGWKSGAAHYFVDDRTQSTVFEDKKPDFKKMKKAEMQELLEDIFSDKISTTVMNEAKPSRSVEHPTMKPIKLLARQIKNSSKQGELVLDLFGGSGSTLIACEQLNRSCYMMEYDPKYADVIIKRWEDFTGKKAILL